MSDKNRRLTALRSRVPTSPVPRLHTRHAARPFPSRSGPLVFRVIWVEWLPSIDGDISDDIRASVPTIDEIREVKPIEFDAATDDVEVRVLYSPRPSARENRADWAGTKTSIIRPRGNVAPIAGMLRSSRRRAAKRLAPATGRMSATRSRSPDHCGMPCPPRR